MIKSFWISFREFFKRIRRAFTKASIEMRPRPKYNGYGDDSFYNYLVWCDRLGIEGCEQEWEDYVFRHCKKGISNC